MFAFASSDTVAEQPSSLVQGLAYVGGLAAVALFAVFIAQTPKVLAASETKAEWREVERPYPAFALTIPEAGEAPTAYSILRHATGGGRKDILSLGDRQGAGPYLWVEIYRASREIERFGDASSEIAARTGDLGPAEALRREDVIDSKFGQLSAVSFVATRGIPRKCVGFVRAHADARLQISGIFCQAGSDFVAPSTLSCALDRLTLFASGNDAHVAELFARAEIRRTFCGERNSLMAPTPKYRMLWKALDQRQQRASAKQLPAASRKGIVVAGGSNAAAQN